MKLEFYFKKFSIWNILGIQNGFWLYLIAKDNVKCCKDKGISDRCLGLCESPSSQQMSMGMIKSDFPPSHCDQFRDEINECVGQENITGNYAYLNINSLQYRLY